jgi:dihydrofolate synthase/folylpolyglutamate synthase
VPGDPLEYLFGLEQFGIKFGLANINAIVAALGHPERSFASVHIAGTNGKGSVTALVDAALRSGGYRSARYTSPHLVDLTERFVVDGRPVTGAAMRDAVDTVRRVVDDLRARGVLEVHPTFFEVTTATAFELFERAMVDVAVCEVGLGGRFDATNVIEPTVAAITSIALDHELHLGTSLGAIAGEKAGIIKPHVPIVVGALDAEAEAVVSRVARERGAELIHAWDGVSVDAHRAADDVQIFRLRTASNDYGEITLPLPGAHQIGNAVVAVAIVEALARRGMRVPNDAVRHGFRTVWWPGRLQRIRLEDGRELMLDAAHNPAGAGALAAFLDTMPPRPMVFGVMRDKQVGAMLEILAPRMSAMIATRISTPRSADPQYVADLARRVRPELDVRTAESAQAALASAWRTNRHVVVAGSIFLLGDVLKTLGLTAAPGDGPS